MVAIAGRGFDWGAATEFNDPEASWSDSLTTSVKRWRVPFLASSGILLTAAVLLVMVTMGYWHRSEAKNSPITEALSEVPGGAFPDSVAVAVAHDPVTLELVAEAQDFLLSPDAPEHPKISSVEYDAVDQRIAGRSFIAQPAELADGSFRTAYFEAGETLRFDEPSFAGESVPAWEWFCSSGNGGERPSFDSGHATLELCRVYVRPADYYNYDFDSPDKFLCFQIEDAQRRYVGWSYVQRDSPVGKEFERIFGDYQIAPADGQPVTRFWQERSMTLELQVAAQSMEENRRQFMVSRIVADSWLILSPKN